MRDRIDHELGVLRDGGQAVEYLEVGGRGFVIYRGVPTAGSTAGLPSYSDVIVPVPSGYPAGMIDLAGLPVGSPLLGRVKGGGNNQGNVTADGHIWQLASYHPHTNGGGPPWNPARHGFHTYFDHVLAWLDVL